ncbi:putative two component transcriptional regulator [Magnetofaba australis IT-1]|uniref:Putative two component transcriptional regulator n=2 Tax=Magnetofaba TaxID=1472292 RepID=A0A1Y2K3V4_9PROT|nr:putative two component transcriptional regulator [Magnetofaba australis IT-1]
MGGGETLAVLDDDPEFREEIALFLSSRGFACLQAATGAELSHLLGAQRVDLVVIDVLLQASGEDGMVICQQLKQRDPALGAVILTCLSQTKDHVRGLQSGADAFLPKGGDLLVLEATIRNILARRAQLASATGAPHSDPASGWTLDLKSWRLIAPDGGDVSLTHMERLFLHALASVADGVLGRNEALAALGKEDTVFEHRNLDNLVRRLRRKVEKETGLPLPLATAYGKGYACNAPLRVIEA